MKSSKASTPYIVLFVIISSVFWSAPVFFYLFSAFSNWPSYIVEAGRIVYLLILALIYIVVLTMTVIMVVKIRKQGVVIKSQFIILIATQLVTEAVMALTPIVVPFASKIILGGAV